MIILTSPFNSFDTNYKNFLTRDYLLIHSKSNCDVIGSEECKLEMRDEK
jgi:hypothetical protein